MKGADTGWQLRPRAEAIWDDAGGLVEGAAGLAVAPGLTLACASELTVWSGRWWAAAAPRLVGRPVAAGRSAADAVLDPRWPDATTLPLTESWRAADPAWRIDVPRALVGVRLGRWAISAGWTPFTVGPGLSGGLTASATAPAYPALTCRRVLPFVWSGFLKPVAPSLLLLRLGATSRQDVHYSDAAGAQRRAERPVLLQWLIGWNHTAWWRSHLTESAFAAPRGAGSVWLDLPQVAFPFGGTTWTELDRGPITDRILSVTTEVCFRDAPWPLLPSRAGRLWVEYGGEDAILEGVPEISAPGAVIGCELVDDHGDLALEYSETRHPTVLWYANAGFGEGFSHDGWVLGLPTGGAAETWHAIARWRPVVGGRDEWTLDARQSVWADHRALPGTARRAAVSLSWRRGHVLAALSIMRESYRTTGVSEAADRHIVARLAYDLGIGP